MSVRLPGWGLGALSCIIVFARGLAERLIELARKYFNDVLTLRAFAEVYSLFVGNGMSALARDVE